MEKTRDEKLQDILGEEFGDYAEFRAARDKKAKITTAKEVAATLVSENGKYGVEYKRHADAMDAIWKKALGEGYASVGLELETKD